MKITAASGRARPRRAGWLMACIVLAVATSVVFGSAAPPAAADSPATAVLDWNKHAFDALNNAPTNPTTPGAGMTTPVQAVTLPMVQGAVYDESTRSPGTTSPTSTCLPRRLGLASCGGRCCARRARRGAEPDAAHGHVHCSIRQAIIERLDLREAESIAAATSADGAGAVADGVDAGEAAAAAMIVERAGDAGARFDSRAARSRASGDRSARWCARRPRATRSPGSPKSSRSSSRATSSF